MADNNTLPTVADEKTHNDTAAAHRETGESSSGHREHDFIEKFEHTAPGYGNERGVKAIDDLADEDNPNVHEHVRLENGMAKVAGEHAANPQTSSASSSSWASQPCPSAG